jgi:hypothetical protein
MRLTIEQIKKNHKILLLNSEDVIDPIGRVLEPQEQRGHNDLITLYYPSVDKNKKYRLKGDIGTFYFHETYTLNNDIRRVHYAYCFESEYHKYSYDCEYGPNNTILLPYKFHFDMDLLRVEDDSHHPPFHLQVLHNNPRFEYKEIDLTDFILYIRKFFYKKDGTPYLSALTDNRRR